MRYAWLLNSKDTGTRNRRRRKVPRRGKNPACVTVLPESTIEPLRAHLLRVKALHERDLAEGCGEAHLPFALARKYPRAGYRA